MYCGTSLPEDQEHTIPHCTQAVTPPSHTGCSFHLSLQPLFRCVVHLVLYLCAFLLHPTAALAHGLIGSIVASAPKNRCSRRVVTSVLPRTVPIVKHLSSTARTPMLLSYSLLDILASDLASGTIPWRLSPDNAAYYSSNSFTSSML